MRRVSACRVDGAADMREIFRCAPHYSADQVHLDQQDISVGDEPCIAAIPGELPIRTCRVYRGVGQPACAGSGERTSTPR